MLLPMLLPSIWTNFIIPLFKHSVNANIAIPYLALASQAHTCRSASHIFLIKFGSRIPATLAVIEVDSCCDVSTLCCQIAAHQGSITPRGNVHFFFCVPMRQTTMCNWLLTQNLTFQYGTCTPLSQKLQGLTTHVYIPRGYLATSR